jgi:AcrR family transcriptional regulator
MDDRIIQAARELLREEDRGFTIGQLANKVNLSRASVYRLIGSKQALMQYLADTRADASSSQRDVRTRILQAARRVLGRYGPINATIEQIADEAGIGVATVYRHFGDKDRLIQAFIAELSPRPFVRHSVHPGEDMAADLKALTDMLLPSFYEYRDILRFILVGNPTERAAIEQLRIGSERTLDQIAAYFAAQINAGRVQATLQPQELALAYMGLLFAFAVIGPTHYGIIVEKPKRVVDLIVQIFMDGLPRAST